MLVRKLFYELNRQELLYIGGTMLLIATKALGFEESTMVFRIIMIVGCMLIGVKILLDKNSVKEWVVIILSIGFGVFQFFNMGSLGLFILLVLFAGMKKINIRRLFEVLAVEYTICFLLITILAYYEVIDPNYVTTIKHGIELTRNSLGYAHPNVLQITYVVVMCLLLYAGNFHGRKFVLVLSCLLIGDIVIYQFSASETGLIVSFAVVLLSAFCEYYHYHFGRAIQKWEKVILNVFIVLVMVGYIAFSLWLGAMSLKYDYMKHLYELVNVILNQRVIAIGVIHTFNGMRLFGGMLDTYGGWALDCSYAYALYSYGLVFYTILIFIYFGTINYLIRKNRILDIAIMVALMIGGITEPFLFNVSVKNLTIFMIGEYIFSLLQKNEIEE